MLNLEEKLVVPKPTESTVLQKELEESYNTKPTQTSPIKVVIRTVNPRMFMVLRSKYWQLMLSCYIVLTQNHKTIADFDKITDKIKHTGTSLMTWADNSSHILYNYILC